MIGPLPRIPRYVLAAVAILTFLVSGAWMAQQTSCLVAPWGSVVGAAVGVVVAYLLVHDFHRRASTAGRPVRRD